MARIYRDRLLVYKISSRNNGSFEYYDTFEENLKEFTATKEIYGEGDELSFTLKKSEKSLKFARDVRKRNFACIITSHGRSYGGIITNVSDDLIFETENILEYFNNLIFTTNEMFNDMASTAIAVSTLYPIGASYDTIVKGAARDPAYQYMYIRSFVNANCKNIFNDLWTTTYQNYFLEKFPLTITGSDSMMSNISQLAIMASDLKPLGEHLQDVITNKPSSEFKVNCFADSNNDLCFEIAFPSTNISDAKNFLGKTKTNIIIRSDMIEIRTQSEFSDKIRWAFGIIGEKVDVERGDDGTGKPVKVPCRYSALVERETAGNYVLPVSMKFEDAYIFNDGYISGSPTTNPKNQVEYTKSYLNSFDLIDGSFSVYKTTEIVEKTNEIQLGDTIMVSKDRFGETKIYKVRILSIEDDSEKLTFNFEEDIEEYDFRPSVKRAINSRETKYKKMIKQLQEAYDKKINQREAPADWKASAGGS